MNKVALIAIYGSPRENGNSDMLLNEFLKGAEASSHAPHTVERIFARKFNITACRGCHACGVTGTCIVSDDMAGLYKKLEQADCMVVSSPIFFYGVPSQLKAIIDRTQAFWAGKYRVENPDPSTGRVPRGCPAGHPRVPRDIGGQQRTGIFLAVCASKGQKVFDGAKLTIRYFFDACGFEYKHELFVRGVELKGDILSRTDDMRVAYELGKNL